MLPSRPTPEAGEVIDSYLERVAGWNGISHRRFLTLVTEESGSLAFLPYTLDPRVLTRLAVITGQPEHSLEQLLLRDLPGSRAAALDPTNRNTWRQFAARGWSPQRGTALCPTCIRDNGTRYVLWRHPWVTTCQQHEIWLLDRCPTCHRRFRSQRTPLTLTNSREGTCANPTQGSNHGCPQRPTEISTEPAPAEVMSSQARIQTAIAGALTPVLGHRAQPDEYLQDLRALATLLLHLACQPGGDRLAAWVPEAVADRTRSAGDRHARWGLAPPRDIRLRGRVLADADAILCRTDRASAVDRLHNWTDLTPTTNDGQLAWLADHTTMTPTLTLLVMAATAGHRRLSSLLRTAPPLCLPSTALPQVLPCDLYRQGLGDLLDVADETGRLFGALAVAYRHLPVTSWSDAALTLGLPGELGTKSARAVSARMRGSPKDVLRCIDALVTALAGAGDFRYRERVVRQLAKTSRWYRSWTRTHRPGSHASSQGYAVTWLWTEYAAGHLDLSPGWSARPPTCGQRALYRRYAARLNPAAASELIAVAQHGSTARPPGGDADGLRRAG